MEIVATPTSLFENVLEFHYSFNDDSHSMDAVVQNKCEYEILGILKEISTRFEAQITIETEPLAEGGLRRYLRIVAKDENQKGTLTSALILLIITTLLAQPVTKISEKLIDKLFENVELVELQKHNLKLQNEKDSLEIEKSKLELEKLKQEVKYKINPLNQNVKIRKLKSNYYQTLDKYPKVVKVSFLCGLKENKYIKVVNETIVERKKFKEFILTSDDLEPVEEENAIIEIISPVLKKESHYKWSGFYKGSIIVFNMKSNEFKTSVQTGQIEFKNGSSINCLLQIKKKIDNEGNEKNVEYNVSRVNIYFQNEKPIETFEGRLHRNQEEANKNQLSLPFS